MKRRDRYGHCSARAPGTPSDADLEPVRADVLVPLGTAGSAAAEHGVARDAAADPPRVDARRRRAATVPAPLVAEPHRIRRVTLVQVRHLAGEELDIGAAHADALDVDDDLSWTRDRAGDLLHPPCPGPVTTKALMVCAHAVIVSLSQVGCT